MMDFWKNGAIPHDPQLLSVASRKLPQHTKAKTLLNTLMALELFEVEYDNSFKFLKQFKKPGIAKSANEI